MSNSTFTTQHSKLTPAPIVLLTYNRPWHTKQTIEALEKNNYAEQSDLFIFSDGPKSEKDEPKVKEVREYLKTISGFKKIEIIERDKNWGLANNIIDGVTKIVNEYGNVIVLEDDLDTSPYFLKFMNEALKMYKDEPNVVSIHGYIYPIDNLPETFFIRGADCWGWATWKDKWAIFEPDGQKLLEEVKRKKLQKEADFNGSYGYTQMLKDQIKGKNDSWAIRWYFSAFLRGMLTLYPGVSYVRNIGFGFEATHCKGTKCHFDVTLSQQLSLSKIEAKEDIIIRAKIEKFLKSIKPNLFQKLKHQICGLL